MVWFCMLLTADLVGFSVMVAAFAGWGVSLSVYTWSSIGLLFLGSATLVFHLIRSVASWTLGLTSLRLGTRIERSLVRAAALLALSTSLLTIGHRLWPTGVILSAACTVTSCLLILTRFRRYLRWQSIRIRRESSRWK